jgi:carboxyl-terminal processing protease
MSKKTFTYLRTVLILVLVSASLLLLIRANVLPGRALRTQDYRDYRILGTAINFVKYNYVDEPNARMTMTGAFKGMIDALDVLSSYLDKVDMEKFGELGKTLFTETGLTLYKRFGGFPQVIGVREGSPAFEAGLQPGSIISAMDNLATLGMSMQEANLYLKGREEKPVTLQILEANQNREVVVGRTRPSKKPFTLKSGDGGATIISIHRLYAPIVKELISLIPSLKKDNNPLILDLRNCTGGSYSEARGLVNLFLKADQIGYFEGREGGRENLACPDDPLLVDIPLYIWTNRATFGPAEVAAGVLQKRKRARIVGIKTPGLTARQKLYRFDDGTGIILTTSIFHYYNDEELWLKGVEPDSPVKDHLGAYSSFWDSTVKLFSDK